MEGSYTTDEVEMQARKKGYPVIQGEQIVPFRTWVQTKNRGNYNKHDSGTADNVAILYDNMLPVSVAISLPKWC